MESALKPERIETLAGAPIYPGSVVSVADATFFLARTQAGKWLGILAQPGNPVLRQFSGDRMERSPWLLSVCALSHANASALREVLTWLRPQPLGLHTSAGCGDRLGLATPGHVRAAREVQHRTNEPPLALILAQQSIREMTRTGRSPQVVLDDATWGTFQEGWQEGIGADADHLKTLEDVDSCAVAGYSLYTVDPGERVDSAADRDNSKAIQNKYDALPWPELESTPRDLRSAYVRRRFSLETGTLVLEEESVLRAAVKYGRAVSHAAKMYRHLSDLMGDRSFEFEVSVDETETPTSSAEHLFVAKELQRLGVRWVSLAPRFVGRFEKGVDYIGDLDQFEREFAVHAAIARELGPYKLSLHSGSDKFSVYAIAARHAQSLLHLKTAGTSYLEALRATAHFDPALFREIASFALEHYETDRASYHVSARLDRVPALAKLPDEALPTLLDQFDSRQVLHVTFGSVLTSEQGFKTRLLAGLMAHEEEHYAALERHFVRHLEPLQRR
jgi:hypothetical protein